MCYEHDKENERKMVHNVHGIYIPATNDLQMIPYCRREEKINPFKSQAQSFDQAVYSWLN